MTATDPAAPDEPRTQTPVLLAAATVVVWIVLVALDHDGAGWLLLPVLGLATAVTAWRSGGGSPRNLRVFIPFVIGALAVVTFLAFVIADA